jgi:alanine dehydrogenase
VTLIDAETVARLLDLPSLIEAMREGHRAGVDAYGRMLMEVAPDALLAMGAWQRGAAFGVKLASVFPRNVARGLTNIASVYVLFDGANGTPVTVMDATPLTLRKTAADSALAADYLARRDARALLMVGAGAQAPWLIAAHRVVRPGIERVMIWNRTPARAAMLATSVADAEAVPDLADAVARADIVCCATAATTPLLRGEWLAPGTHVDLVGGYTPTMREADDAAIRRARVFVDTRRFTLHDAGDIAQPFAAGLIAERDVADLFELVRGTAEGRRNAAEITLFKNGGGGHLDLMAARLVVERAGLHLGLHL